MTDIDYKKEFERARQVLTELADIAHHGGLLLQQPTKACTNIKDKADELLDEYRKRGIPHAAE